MNKRKALKQNIENIKRRLQNKHSVHDYTFFDSQERIKFKEILSDKLSGQNFLIVAKT